MLVAIPPPNFFGRSNPMGQPDLSWTKNLPVVPRALFTARDSGSYSSGPDMFSRLGSGSDSFLYSVSGPALGSMPLQTLDPLPGAFANPLQVNIWTLNVKIMSQPNWIK